MPAKVHCLGVPISPAVTLGELTEAVGDALSRRARLLVTFVNPWICSKWNSRKGEFESIFEGFDYVCCDGIGMVIAARMTLNGLGPERISFDETSFAGPFFKACASAGREVVLVGGQPGVAQAAAQVIARKFTGLDIAAVFDGYGEVAAAVQFLEEHPRHAVVCGMGTPYQERFLLRASEAGWSGVGATCGGFLDQVDGFGKYYPRWVDATHTRWAYRLYREPRRLWRRYLLEYWPFAIRLTMAIASRARRRYLGRGIE